MKTFVNVVLGVVLCVTGVVGCSSKMDTPSPVTGEPARALPADVRAAWEKAGAETGWMSQGPSVLTFRAGLGTAKAGEIPAFDLTQANVRSRPVEKTSGGLTPGSTDELAVLKLIPELPSPAEPFGLHLGGLGVRDSTLKELSGLGNLHSLNLAFTQVSDAGMKDLVTLKELRSLHLAGTEVTDVGLQQLAQLRHLESLYFINNRITDKGLKALIGLKELHTLSLENTQVTDACITDLAGIEKLRTLTLAKTKVTDLGVRTLKRTLPEVQVVR